MRRFSLFLGSVLVGALLLQGCGSDDPPATNACVGSYSDFTPAKFTSQTTSGKACSSDSAAVCSKDVTGIVGSCGKSCFIQAPTDDESQAACVTPCIAGSVTLSDACVSCYVEDVACARDKCFKDCGLTPGSPECAACRLQQGCASAFYGCSGLPLPTGVDLGNAGDGDGASGSGN